MCGRSGVERRPAPGGGAPEGRRGDAEQFLPESGGGRPFQEGGPRLWVCFADSSSRATSTSGWMWGRREGRGPHPLDGALCSAPRAVSSTTRAKGCLETQPKGTRLRSSGRLSGACPAAPRDYQAQSQLTWSAEPICEARPPCGRRRRGRTSRGGRPRPSAYRRGGRVAGSTGGPGERRGPGPRGAIRGRGRFPQNGPPPSDFNDGFEVAGAQSRSRKPDARVLPCAMLRSKGRILYDRAKGCLETQPKGTRLRSSGRCSGICRAAPRDYQAQSHSLSPPRRGRPRWRV